MVGGTDLEELFGNLAAELVDGLYVFATVSDGVAPAGVRPRMLLHEAEGITLILLKEEAEANDLAYEFPCRMITLNIHSSLEAVGFMARIATALARHDMGVNPVSGFFHDHLFVPDGREMDAIRVLKELTTKT